MGRRAGTRDAGSDVAIFLPIERARQPTDTDVVDVGCPRPLPRTRDVGSGRRHRSPPDVRTVPSATFPGSADRNETYERVFYP